MDFENYKKIIISAQENKNWIYDINDLIFNKNTGIFYKIINLDLKNIYAVKYNDFEKATDENDCCLIKLFELKNFFDEEKITEVFDNLVEIPHTNFYDEYYILLTHTHVYLHFLQDEVHSSDLNEYFYEFFKSHKILPSNVFEFYGNYIIAYMEYDNKLKWSSEKEKFIEQIC